MPSHLVQVFVPCPVEVCMRRLESSDSECLATSIYSWWLRALVPLTECAPLSGLYVVLAPVRLLTRGFLVLEVPAVICLDVSLFSIGLVQVLGDVTGTEPRFLPTSCPAPVLRLHTTGPSDKCSCGCHILGPN